MTLFLGGGPSARRCCQRAMTGINQIIYWIITPHWLRVARSRARARAPASLIWQRAAGSAQWLLDTQQKNKWGERDKTHREPRFQLFFFCSLCIRMSVHIPPWIIHHLTPPSTFPSLPPSSSNPRLCVAAEPVRLRGPSFTASAGHCHTCLIFSFFFFIWNNSALLVRPKYSSRSFPDLLLPQTLSLSHTGRPRRN